MEKTLTSQTELNFNNTAIAFSYKTDEELKRAEWLFKMMSNAWLVQLGSKVGLTAMKLNLPLAESTIKSTIFEHFCGGTSLLNAQDAIEQLYKHKVQSVLDYGVEVKNHQKGFNNSMNQYIRAIEFAATTKSISTISVKITTLARVDLLTKIQSGNPLNEEETKEYKYILKRIDSICYVAHERKVVVFIDAEESWVQNTIDFIARRMMRRYNKEQAIVFNTYQLYRRHKIDYLFDSFDDAKREDYILGAKLVRGAYMDKERARATEQRYASPIQTNKRATDNDYNTAIQFCVDNYLNIASIAATHNIESCLLQADLILKKGIQKNHPHLNFCQLYGMGDNISLNLAAAGFNVAKYVVYGPVKEVIPFLIRRAEENTSITGEVGREHTLVMREMRRRGIA